MIGVLSGVKPSALLTRSVQVAIASMLAVACTSDSSSGDTTMSDGGDTESECSVMGTVEFPAANESACATAASDYVPGSNTDPFAACVTDDGNYHLVEGTPSSVARVEAFDEIVTLLRGTPGLDEFTMARTVYAIDEGLESRVLRREDLHYPAVPAADFDPDFEDDKQCSSPANVSKYPDRCAGPAKIAPLIDAAFVGGMTGEGMPEIHAAQIEAAGLWFLFLSAYKEANTCINKAKDCDSSWAYYTGGFDRLGGIGLSGEVRDLSDLAHNRVFDGIAAVRCWRELYPIEDYPTRDDLDAEGEQLLQDALEQLDTALWYSFARVVRDRIERQDASCGIEAEANLAFLAVAGPVLDFEASRRGAPEASTLAALWANSAPTPAELEAGVAALDVVFPCP